MLTKNIIIVFLLIITHCTNAFANAKEDEKLVQVLMVCEQVFSTEHLYAYEKEKLDFKKIRDKIIDIDLLKKYPSKDYFRLIFIGTASTYNSDPKTYTEDNLKTCRNIIKMCAGVGINGNSSCLSTD